MLECSCHAGGPRGAYGTRSADQAGTVLTTLATYSNREAAPTYQQHGHDLSACAGRTVILAFNVNSTAAATDFALDDITLTVH